MSTETNPYTEHLEDYLREMKHCFGMISRNGFLDALSLLQNSMQPHHFPRRIFVCGNGGSASLSQHLACDHMKGVREDTDREPEVISLSTNMAIVTAIANDIGFEEIFSRQLKYHSAKSTDLLIAISASGDSPNVINAVKYAHTKCMQTISMVGFDGGELYNIYDSHRSILVNHALLHVHSRNYGVIEDIHQVLMHALAQTLRKRYRTSITQKL